MNKTNIKDINLKVAMLIKNEVTQVSYDTWLKYMEDAYIEGNNIIIEVGNLFQKLILEEKYLTLLENAYSQFMDELGYSKILIKVTDKTDELEETKEISAQDARKLADEVNLEVNIEKQVKEKLAKIYRMIKSCSKSGEYTFETIIDYGAMHLITKGITESLEKNGYKVSIESHNDKDKTILKIEW